MRFALLLDVRKLTCSLRMGGAFGLFMIDTQPILLCFQQPTDDR